MKRIFVRGPSRSGGTLLVTALDAHPLVSMSYEIYQHLLAPREGERDSALRLLDELARAARRPHRAHARMARRIEDPRLRTFASRALRGGIEVPQLHALLRAHQAEGLGLATVRERMLFVERIGLEKARREGKPHWGVKISGVYEEIHELFPDAHFLFVLRDGRDVAASRSRVGEFNQSITEIAEGWCGQIERFEALARRPDVRAQVVGYETLTADPRGRLRALCTFLDLPWDEGLLEFSRRDLTLFRNPTGHLSAAQLRKPINPASVGRWQRELASGQVADFERVAGETLRRLGYARSGVAADAS